ncbi:uncharacterized protein C11orf87 homolog [Amia ocellicauda]|uniref:uncharacterized protein C11orf87 homolog n=1 Tax=Amia ocellicauda TaxID=2972642 RepID=UPI003464CFA2
MRPRVPGSSLSVPLEMGDAHPGVSAANYTQDVAAPRHADDSLSSIIALMVVLALACAVIVTSLVTFYCHKLQLQGKKLRKAQEEYERDHGQSNPQPSREPTDGLQSP